MIRVQRSGLIMLAVACCITVIDGAAAADEKNSSRTPLNSVQTYGPHNKECLEWTDTCVNCVRTGSSGAYSCSNIGIACQPKSVECLKRSVKNKTE